MHWAFVVRKQRYSNSPEESETGTKRVHMGSGSGSPYQASKACRTKERGPKVINIFHLFCFCMRIVVVGHTSMGPS